MYRRKNGIWDLRPVDYERSGEYQGDTIDNAKLRNQWDDTYLQGVPGVTATVDAIVERCLPGCRVLDAGCGTGHVTRWIAQQVGPAVQIVATDVSAAMSQIARHNCADLDQVTVIRAVSSHPMPFRSSSFDIVFTRLAPMNDELAHELLRPGGWFIRSGLGDAQWRELNEIFGDRCITFATDDREPMERLIQSGFVEAELHGWRYTEHLTPAEILSVVEFAPILHDGFHQQHDSPLLEELTRRYGTPKGIALTAEETLLLGQRN